MGDNNVTIKLNLSGKESTSDGLKEVARQVNNINTNITQIKYGSAEAGDASDGLLGKLLAFGSAFYVLERVTGAVYDLGKSLVSTAVSVASANQQAQIGFTTLLGSAGKANDFIGKLQKFAEVTPFEFAGLQTSSQQLLAVGISADKIIPIMTALGNATSAMGTGQEGIDRAVVAIQQMNAAQAIHAQDLNQLRDAGVPVYELLSKALGKTTKQVSDLVQGGRLGQDALNKMMAALENGTGLERFNGMMDKQSKTLAGVYSNLHDIVTIGLGKSIAPLLPELTDAVNFAVAETTPLFAWLDRKAKDLGTVMPMWIDYSKLKLREAQPYFDEAWQSMRLFGRETEKAAYTFGKGFVAGGGPKALLDLLVESSNLMATLANGPGARTFGQNLATIIDNLAGALRALDDSIKAVEDVWKPFAAAQGEWNDVQKKSSDLGTKFGSSVKGESVGDFGSDVWGDLSGLGTKFGRAVSGKDHATVHAGAQTSASSSRGFVAVRPTAYTAPKAATVSSSAPITIDVHIDSHHHLDGKQLASATVSQVARAAARK